MRRAAGLDAGCSAASEMVIPNELLLVWVRPVPVLLCYVIMVIPITILYSRSGGGGMLGGGVMIHKDSKVGPKWHGRGLTRKSFSFFFLEI